jgi:hypothetical protein
LGGCAPGEQHGIAGATSFQTGAARKGLRTHERSGTLQLTKESAEEKISVVGAPALARRENIPEEEDGKMSTNVNITNIFISPAVQQAIGMGQVTGTADQVVKAAQKQLAQIAATSFTAQWPNAPSNAAQSGVMGPWDNSLAGTTPKCAFDQIQLDFQNWQMQTPPNVINQMLKTITTHLANSMGVAGHFAGSSALTSNEVLWWCVAFAIVDAGQSNPPEQAVVYAYTASEGLDLS